MQFNELNLIEPLLEAVNHLQYKEATQIQSETIPVILEGRDLLGIAKTGTGKTAAFVFPILQKLYLRDESEKYPRTIKALIVAPTRELAIQIDEVFQALRLFVNLKSACIFGGVGQGQQVLKIERGIDVLIATPGRLCDLHKQGLLDLSRVEYFVIDEADRMLDMGFIKDIYKIIKFLPEKKQTMLFSATLPDDIQHLVDKILHHPVRIMVSSGHTTVEKIDQSLYYVDKLNKGKLLIKLLENPQIYNAIVFVRTKKNAETLCKKLQRAHITCESIHGDKSQNARMRALNNFKSDKARILVATDIAARGIDIDYLSHVINFDLPELAENYVHRIGRTARASQDGAAITFCSYQERDELKEIEKFIGEKIPVIENIYYPMEDLSELPQKGKSQKKKVPPKKEQNKKTQKQPVQPRNNKAKDLKKKKKRVK